MGYNFDGDFGRGNGWDKENNVSNNASDLIKNESEWVAINNKEYNNLLDSINKELKEQERELERVKTCYCFEFENGFDEEELTNLLNDNDIYFNNEYMNRIYIKDFSQIEIVKKLLNDNNFKFKHYEDYKELGDDFEAIDPIKKEINNLEKTIWWLENLKRSDVFFFDEFEDKEEYVEKEWHHVGNYSLNFFVMNEDGKEFYNSVEEYLKNDKEK